MTLCCLDEASFFLGLLLTYQHRVRMLPATKISSMENMLHLEKLYFMKN
jgi:hypothetical protein